MPNTSPYIWLKQLIFFCLAFESSSQFVFFQNCEKLLEDLGVKVIHLQQDVMSTPVTNDLPAEILSTVESLYQQYNRYKLKQPHYFIEIDTIVKRGRCILFQE